MHRINKLIIYVILTYSKTYKMFIKIIKETLIFPNKKISNSKVRSFSH